MIRLSSFILTYYKKDVRNARNEPYFFSKFIIEYLTNQLQAESTLPSSHIPSIFTPNAFFETYIHDKPQSLQSMHLNQQNMICNDILEIQT